ncbi:MAG: long-chain fatty acid--CoA ligase [Alphaproteobacteria bacterium]|nr:long-chain fatty acid--CoA ligase [Alphaproteobacteria bacterium]
MALRYDAGTAYLHAAPMFHLADGCSSFAVTMCAGRHVFLPRFEPVAFRRLVRDQAVTDSTIVPTMMAALVNDPAATPADYASLRRLYYGAAPMPEATIRRALALLPQVKFQQAWGMTELSPIGCTIEPRYSVVDGPDAGRLASCGKPVSSVELRILDAVGREVPRGTVGEIAVRGPTVMQGYWNRPAETAEALRGGWMHSGDAAYMDEQGFVFIVDRLKDMIVSGGENVYSAEVENAISLLPGVAEVAVVGVPDPRYGEAVHAIIVPRPGARLDAEQVIAACRERIAGYKCPRAVTFRAEPLPLSAAGKVLKAELRAPFWAGRESRLV